MDFGFIQVAAPASQPGPLADPSVSVDLSKDAAAAFDAALAATLGPADVKAEQGAAAGGRVAQPAWLMASLFAPTVTAFDAAAASATTTEDIAPAEQESVPTDVAADEERRQGVPVDRAESPDQLAGLPAGVPVPMPVVAEIKPTTWFGQANPVVPEGGPVADAGIAVTGEQTQAKAVLAQPREAALAQPRVAAIGFESAVAAGRVAAAASAYAGKTQAVPVDGPAITALPDAAVAQMVAGNTGVAPMNTGVAATTSGADPVTVPVDQPFAADALTGIATGQRETQAPAKTALPRPELPTVAAQPTEAAQNVAATTAVANAIAAVADHGAASVTNGATTAARTEPAESAAAARLAVSWEAQSHQDAPMTGQDQQGQGRQSAEFTRFAAALAQVSSGAGEEAGRTAGPVVSPVASTPTAAAVAAQATVATGAASQVSTAETPDAENVGRLVQAMRVISRPGAWEANVRLKPEHLGEVNIAVRVERNTVSAVVNAEAAGVRQWLESQEQTVRTGMAEHGLHLERFVVQRDGQRRDAEPQQQQPESRRQSRRQAAPTERFEVVV